MPWRDAHTLHIFAPPEEPYGNNWVEQILGGIVRPLYRQYKNPIKWIWLTRYSDRYNEETPPAGCLLPERYRSNGYYRFVAFRTSVAGDSKNLVYNQALQFTNEQGCYADPRGWLEYDVIADLGSDRFIGPDATVEERTARAKLVVDFVDVTIKLMLDLLVQDAGGKWIQAPGTHQQNPNRSVFESVHHLFCNVTSVPTTVLLISRNKQLRYVKTHWMPFDFDPELDVIEPIPVNY